MKLKIQNTQLVIGAALTTEQALNLPLVAPEQAAFTYNDKQYLGSFCSLPEHGVSGQGLPQDTFNEYTQSTKSLRCIELLNQLLALVAQADICLPLSTPIFWLLPTFVQPVESTSNVQAQHNSANTTFTHFAKQLQQALPTLFQHPKSQFFPFGRAAFPIALAAAKTFFTQQATDTTNQNDTITFISVDSFLHDLPSLIANNSLVTAESEHGIVPSEGAIFTQLTRANENEEAITVEFTHAMVAPSKQRVTTAEQLFTQSIECLIKDNEQSMAPEVTKPEVTAPEIAMPETIAQLYLPGNGDETLQQSWLDAYFQLAGHIDGDTRITQSALFTGELGSNTGLYNFLHLATGYKHKFIQGNALQLEVSDTLHQGITMYSWNKA